MSFTARPDGKDAASDLAFDELVLTDANGRIELYATKNWRDMHRKISYMFMAITIILIAGFVFAMTPFLQPIFTHETAIQTHRAAFFAYVAITVFFTGFCLTVLSCFVRLALRSRRFARLGTRVVLDPDCISFENYDAKTITLNWNQIEALEGRMLFVTDKTSNPFKKLLQPRSGLRIVALPELAIDDQTVSKYIHGFINRQQAIVELPPTAS